MDRRILTLLMAAVLLALPPVAHADGRKFTRGLQATNELSDPYLREMRTRMIAGQSIPYEAMRALADLGDGYAALKVGRYLESTGEPALVVDAAHYYAISAYTGRGAGIWPLVRILKTHGSEIPQARLDNMEIALKLHADHGHEAAAAALAQFYLEGKPFGSHPEEAEPYVEAMLSGNNASSALSHVFRTAAEEATTGEVSDTSLRLLRIAAGTDDLRVRATAENMLAALDIPLGDENTLRPVLRDDTPGMEDGE
jgi:TPR repeat protein